MRVPNPYANPHCDDSDRPYCVSCRDEGCPDCDPEIAAYYDDLRFEALVEAAVNALVKKPVAESYGGGPAKPGEKIDDDLPF